MWITHNSFDFKQINVKSGSITLIKRSNQLISWQSLEKNFFFQIYKFLLKFSTQNECFECLQRFNIKKVVFLYNLKFIYITKLIQFYETERMLVANKRGLKFQEAIVENGETECNICRIAFNFSSRIPLILCSNMHSICRMCLDKLKIQSRCPFCRDTIHFDKIVVNSKVLNQNPDNSLTKSTILEIQDQYKKQNQANFSQLRQVQQHRLKLILSFLYLLLVALINTHFAINSPTSHLMDKLCLYGLITLRAFHLYVGVIQILLIIQLICLAVLYQQKYFKTEVYIMASQAWLSIFFVNVLVFGCLNVFIFHNWTKYQAKDTSALNTILPSLDMFIILVFMLKILGGFFHQVCWQSNDFEESSNVVDYPII